MSILIPEAYVLLEFLASCEERDDAGKVVLAGQRSLALMPPSLSTALLGEAIALGFVRLADRNDRTCVAITPEGRRALEVR